MALIYNPLLKIGLDDTGSGTSGGGMSIGGTVTSGTAGSVLFVGTGPVLAQDNSNFFWDDTNNRLGLGTSSPSYLLHLRGSGVRTYIQDTSTSYAMLVAGNSSNNSYFVTEIAAGGGVFTGSGAYSTVVGNSGNYSLHFATQGSLRATILGSGIMGVGMTTPSALLFQVGTASSDSATAPTTVSTSYYIKVGGQEYTASSYRLIGFGYSNDSTRLDTPAYIGSYESGSTGGTSADLVFGTRSVTTATPATERMRILDTGEVGIGTTAPDRQLEINNSSGNCLRLTYNDADGSATNYIDLLVTSGGDLTINPSGGDVTVVRNSTSPVILGVSNTTAGTGSYSQLTVITDACVGNMYAFSSTYTTSGAFMADSVCIQATSATSAGLNIASDHTTTGVIRFYTGGHADADLACTIGINGTFTITGAVAPALGVTQRVVTTTDDATAVIDVTLTDVYELSAVANNTTFSTTGTPADGQKMTIRFKDAGTSKTITWNAIFAAIGVSLPTSTTPSKWHYVGCMYNSAASKFHVLSASVES